jgi:hypothetical protein
MKAIVLLPSGTNREDLGFLNQFSNQLSIVTYIPVSAAKTDFFDVFTSDWKRFAAFLQNNINPPPLSLNDLQHFAFEITKAEIEGMYNLLNPDRIGCILCINQQKPPKNDDIISLILTPVKSDDTLLSFSVSEKWPGLHDDADMDVRARLIKANILTKTDGSVPADYLVAQGWLDAFKNKWKEIRADITSGGAGNRPQVRTTLHPLVFFLQRGDIVKLLDAAVEKIAGVFGFDETAGRPGFIRPMLVGLDGGGRPVTDMAFPVVSRYTMSDEAEIVQKMFTK